MKKNLIMLLAAGAISGCLGFAVPKVLSDSEPGIKVNQEKLKISAQRQYEEDTQKSYEDKYTSTQEEKDAMAGPDTEKKAEAPSTEKKAAAPTTENKAVEKAKASGTSKRELLAKSDAFKKLDTDYLFGLSDNGLTAKESKEADVYMDSKLSGAEYIDARKQYAEYVSNL